MTSRQRKLWSVILYLIPSAKKRTEFMRKHHLYGAIGENCSIQKRKLPLYSNLVFLHNNVKIASNVGFVTHDIIHLMLNQKYQDGGGFKEKVGCIEVMDNVFIGSDSLVNKDIPDNSVYAGVPARFICTFDEYVEKARAWSREFKTLYDIDCPGDVSDKLAQEMYKNFLKDKEQKKG